MGYDSKFITFEHKKIIDFGETYLKPKEFQLDAFMVEGAKIIYSINKTTHLIDSN